jgi:hypothetical protein
VKFFILYLSHHSDFVHDFFFFVCSMKQGIYTQNTLPQLSMREQTSIIKTRAALIEKKGFEVFVENYFYGYTIQRLLFFCNMVLFS